MSSSSSPTTIPTFYSLEEIRAAVDEAHKAGRSVAVHVIGGDAANNVIEAGVDSLEHGFYLTDAQLQRMKDKNIFLVGTDFPKSHLQAMGGDRAGADPPGYSIGQDYRSPTTRAPHRSEVGIRHRFRDRYAQPNAA